MITLTTIDGVAKIDDQLKVTGPPKVKTFAEFLINAEELEGHGIPPLTVLYYSLKEQGHDVEADPEDKNPGADQPKGTVF